MDTHAFRDMFLKAGLPEERIDEVLGYFYTFKVAPEILTQTDYLAAKALYRVMDRRYPPRTLSALLRAMSSLWATD